SGPACVPTAGCDGPSRFPRPQRFYPQALPWLPAPLHPSSDRTDSQQSHDADKSLRYFRSSALPGESATFLLATEVHVVCCSWCLLFGGPESYLIQQSSFSGELHRCITSKPIAPTRMTA